jgi:hypothetical protein
MNILEHLRSLCFGGICGAFLLSILYLKSPQLFPNGFSLEMAFGFGAAIGGAIHRVLNVFVKVFLKPAYVTVSLYWKVAQIILMHRYLGPKFMSENMQKELAESLMKDYFLHKDGPSPVSIEAKAIESAKEEYIEFKDAPNNSFNRTRD